MVMSEFSMSKPTILPPSAEQTRQALIRAALKLFGAKGFDGTSTREIAAAARANIGSIAYHFGGKEGLRLACADFIVESDFSRLVARMNNLAGEPLIDEAHLRGQIEARDRALANPFGKDLQVTALRGARRASWPALRQPSIGRAPCRAPARCWWSRALRQPSGPGLRRAGTGWWRRANRWARLVAASNSA